MALTYIEKSKLRRLRDSKTPTPLWRTFVNITNGHDKYWKISRTNHIVTVEYGANGTDGTTLIKKFPWTWEASQYVTDKIAEKLRKGYEEL